MFECDVCGDVYDWVEDMDQHLHCYDHWQECQTCDRRFRTKRASFQHMNTLDHWAPTYECETCPKEFRSLHAVRQHMNSTGHWRPKVPCDVCNAMFHTQDAADKHMAAKGHYQNYCRECKRQFISENNLRMHLNSKIHRGSSLACPFCNNGYATASGVAHHLETGSCSRAPRMNRETIHRMIRERDQNGFITIQQLEWHQSDSCEFSASSYAFNGDGWECYLCHREFRALSGLNQHLNSPVHKQKVYHCPNRRDRCVKEFSSLAGLFNHLESETCGFTRFERVQQQVHGVFRGGKLLAF